MKKKRILPIWTARPRSDQTLTSYTRDVIANALEQDVIITYATARGYISAQSVVSDIPWKYPLILYNGALIYDGVNRTVIDGYWLERDISNEIIDVGRKFGITPYYFSLDADHRERVLHESRGERERRLLSEPAPGSAIYGSAETELPTGLPDAGSYIHWTL